MRLGVRRRSGYGGDICRTEEGSGLQRLSLGWRRIDLGSRSRVKEDEHRVNETTYHWNTGVCNISGPLVVAYSSSQMIAEAHGWL